MPPRFEYALLDRCNAHITAGPPRLDIPFEIFAFRGTTTATICTDSVMESLNRRGSQGWQVVAKEDVAVTPGDSAPDRVLTELREQRPGIVGLVPHLTRFLLMREL